MNFQKVETLCDLVRGSSPRPQGDKRYYGGDIPRLMVEDVTRDGMYVIPKVDFLTDEGAKLSRPMSKGDLTMVVSGSPGLPSILGVDACIHDGFVGFRNLDKQRIDTEFLYFWFLFRLVESDKNATGAIFRNLTTDQIKNFDVPILEKEKQHQIVTNLKSQLAEVETARQALTVQLADVFQLERLYFDEFELRLFSGAEISLFSNFVESYKNGYGARPKEGETGSIVLRIADVSQGIIDLSSTRQGSISAKDAETYKLEKGNLIFIRVNGAKHIVGKCILVDEIPDGTIFNDHLIRVRLSEEMLPEYAQLCASLPNARQMIEEAASTSAGQLTVNQKILDQIAMPFVDKSRQVGMIDEYRGLCSEISTLKKAINQQLDDLNKIPERLLAQAFSEA